MFRTLLRWAGRALLVTAVVVALAYSPAPVLTLLSWALFAYLVWAAWPRLVVDARRLSRVRVPLTSRGGKYSTRGDGGSL